MRSVAADEPTAPRRLRPEVSRDLEAICLKCLEKEPSRRYASPGLLRDDLGRYLRDEPIRARRQNSIQRLVKWARRQPAVAALVCVSIAAVLALIGLQSWGARQLRVEIAATQRQREAAEVERDRATQRERDTQDLLYATRMQTASAAWRRHDCRTLDMLLDEALPAGADGDRRGFEWHYLHHLSHQQRQTFAGHDAEVYCHALSADGRHLASGDVLGRIIVWNVADSSARILTPGISDPSPAERDVHRTCVNGLVFLPDDRLVSAGCDGTLKIWDWQQSLSPQVLIQRSQRANCLCLAPDGRHLAAGWEDGVLQLIDVTSAEPTIDVRVAETGLETIAISPNGERLAVGGDDPRVHLLDAHTGVQLLPPLTMKNMIYCVAFSPDSQKLAIAPKDETPLVYDARSGQRLFRANADLHRCMAVTFDPAGTVLVGGSLESILRWDAETGEPRGAFYGHTRRIATLGFTSDGSSLYSASWDGEVRCWDAKPPREFERVGGAVEAAQGIALCGRQKFMICADAQNRGVRYDLENGQQLEVLTAASDVPIRRLIVSPTGRYLLVFRAAMPTELYDLQAAPNERQPVTLDAASSVQFSPDESLLLTTSRDGNHHFRLFELPSGQSKLLTSRASQLQELSWPGINAPDVAFSRDGREVIAANPRDIGRWNLATGEQVNHTAVYHILYGVSSQAELAVSNGLNGLCLLDLQTLKPLRALQRIATAALSTACWSPDNRRVATGHDDGSIHFWDVATGMQLLRLEGHTLAVRQMNFSLDGTRLYSFAPRIPDSPLENSELFIWDAEPASK
jgi:WD40 repeat protein